MSVIIKDGVATAVFLGTADAASAFASAASATASAASATASATAAEEAADTARLALDKAGGARLFATATLGSAIAVGTSGSIAGAANILWINPASAAVVHSRVGTLSIPVATVGDGTLTIALVSRVGSTETVENVINLTGLVAGANSVAVDFEMEVGWMLGWWSSTAGAKVNGLATATVDLHSTGTAPTAGDSFARSSSLGQQYPIQASIKYEPNGLDPRIAAAEAAFRTKVTFGAVDGGTGSVTGVPITPLETIAEDGYFDTISVVVDAAGSGLLQIYASDALGNYTVSAQYPVTLPSSGLNSLTVGSPAMLTACPYLPAVVPIPANGRVGFKPLTMNLLFQEGSGSAQVSGDDGIGSAVTIAASQDVSVQVTYRTRSTDQIIPASRDEVLQAAATVSGSNITVAGVLNRNGSPVQFAGTVAVPAVTTGSVVDEAITIDTAVLTGLLAHANVSSVVVKRASDNAVLVEGTDYNVKPDVGIVQSFSGTVAVKVSYNYSKRRYDAVYLNPETQAVGIVAGTERDRDAAEMIAAVPTTAPAAIRLFNLRSTAALIEPVPVWEFFDGQRRELSRQMADERRRARSLSRKVLARLRRGQTVNIGVVGDSTTAFQSATPSLLYNGAERDRGLDGYLNFGIGSDILAGIPKFDFGDGAGTVHTKFGWSWSFLTALADAFGYAINVPHDSGSISTAANTINWFNYAIASTASSSIPTVSAEGLHLIFFKYGMNELPITTGQQIASENQAAAFIAARIAAGTEVIVVGTERPNAAFASAGEIAGWRMINRAWRRAAEANGAAFVDTSAIYDDANLGAIGISPKDTCRANFYVHPGILENGAVGRLTAALLLDE